MRFEYFKIWLRWYWLPYKEETVLDVSLRWLCFEIRLDTNFKTTQAESPSGRSNASRETLAPPPL